MTIEVVGVPYTHTLTQHKTIHTNKHTCTHSHAAQRDKEAGQVAGSMQCELAVAEAFDMHN